MVFISPLGGGTLGVIGLASHQKMAAGADGELNLRFFFEKRYLGIPSRELTYPTLGKGKSSTQNAIFWGIC